MIIKVTVYDNNNKQLTTIHFANPISQNEQFYAGAVLVEAAKAVKEWANNNHYGIHWVNWKTETYN